MKTLSKIIKEVKKLVEYRLPVCVQKKDYAEEAFIIEYYKQKIIKKNVLMIPIVNQKFLSTHMSADPHVYLIVNKKNKFYKKSADNTNLFKNIKTVLVGKGILFDTGGYDIKTHGMFNMFSDKAGACAVLGAIAALDTKQASTTVGLVGFAINLMGQILPSTILTSQKGQKVEIVNTDAEGRLLLADLLETVNLKFKNIQNIITIATLTGAAGYINGNEYGLLFGASSQQMTKYEQYMQQKLMIMPNYHKGLKPTTLYDSKVLSNSKHPYGSNGSDEGYKFLKAFVTKKIHFNHIDIAGIELDDCRSATGYGVEQLLFLTKDLTAK